jgi:disulfide bond formation protein DsbB
MPRPRLHAVAVLCVIGAAGPLALALGSERFGGLVACALCLLERWPYRIAIILALAAAFLPQRWSILALAALVLVMVAGAVLGGVHVGVEQHYWPSPLPECAAPHLASGSIAERLASMPARPSKPCDDPTYLIPGLGLSMAAMNLLYALLFAALLGFYLWQRRRLDDE